ncbi:MAG: nucleotidyltransferase domain-containing protein [Nanoarchaeota archaeon]|nr:nucleotidyltransferase domain-containing protein [Nanoarchaeota archaeon]
MIKNYGLWRVFQLFAKHPLTSFQIREISRKIKLAPTSVKLHLDVLESKKLVKRQKVGVYQAYLAEFDSEDFRFYKKIHNLIELKESGLIDYLDEKTTPNSIVLFGSYSRGEDLEKSDIDLYIQSRKTELDLEKFENKLGREIQTFFSEDIERYPKELQINILRGITLSGSIQWTTSSGSHRTRKGRKGS